MLAKEKNGNIIIEGAKILFRNFEGRQTAYNDEGKRNFNIELSAEDAKLLLAEGWNVRTKPPYEEGDAERYLLEVTVKFKGRTPPRVIMITSKGRNTLNEDTAMLLDFADLENVDLIMRPYDWEVSGKTGRKAYLQSIYATIHEDALEQKYADVEEMSGRSLVAEQLDRYVDEPEGYREMVGEDFR